MPNLEHERARIIAHSPDGIVPKLEKLGAVFKTDGVWRLGDNDFYPYRGWVRNYRTNKGCSIDYFFNVLEKKEGEGDVISNPAEED